MSICNDKVMNIFERLTAQPLRRTSDGYLGGICAGLGHRWDISPFLLRLAVILAAFLGGIGVIAYGLLGFFCLTTTTAG